MSNNMKVNHLGKEKAYAYTYKISENIFGLVQVKGAFCIFFDIFFEHTNKNLKLDLNKINILHYRHIATQRLKNFFVKVESDVQLYDYEGVDFFVLDFFYKAPSLYGANLSKLPKNLDMLPLEIVVSDLSVDKNYNELIKYDLISMIGEVNDIKKRLCIYLETGVDFDNTKNFIFPNLTPKPKTKFPKILSENDLRLLNYIE